MPKLKQPIITQRIKAFLANFFFDDLNILIDFLIDSVPGWHAIQTRVLGVFTYLALRLCKMKFSVAMDIFKKLNVLSMVYLKCY